MVYGTCLLLSQGGYCAGENYKEQVAYYNYIWIDVIFIPAKMINYNSTEK